ncbi:MAG: hypothetical protein QOF49_1090 [Chloroflexota bacterium]|jgi:hypothetical protein|nr:hypothetical protein [Chloroflexota bacterium]
MNDHPHRTPSDTSEDSTDPVAPQASFTGRTRRTTEGIRAGVVVGTGLVVALGAAVAMGASPAATGETGASAAPLASASTDGNRPGSGQGGRFGQAGPGFGPGRPGFGPGGPGGPGGDVGRGGPANGGFGKVSVTAISGSNLSLATDDGWTRTIAATSATTITRGGEPATLADVRVGDEIRFRETRNADATFTITAINIVLPRAAGTVTAVGTDTITITLRDGTSKTIATTGATTYRLGKAAATRADVQVGATIAAAGEQAGDGTLTAKTVTIRLPHVQGTVAATTADTITVTRRDGTTVTIHVAAGATIRVAGVGAAVLSDVKAGMVVAAAGTQRPDGSIDATDVRAGQFGKGRGRDGTNGDGTTPDASSAPDASAGTDG